MLLILLDLKTYLFMDHYMINYLLSTSAFDT